MNRKLAVVLVLVTLVTIFIIQNIAVVEIRFLFWSFSMSRSLLVILLLAAGMTTGWLLHGHIRSRKLQ